MVFNANEIESVMNWQWIFSRRHFAGNNCGPFFNSSFRDYTRDWQCRYLLWSKLTDSML